VGRERELAAAVERVRQPDIRLVTLTGPPGIGKTTLALRVLAQAAPGFRDGAALVPLEAVHHASLVVTTIASALGLPQVQRTSAEEQVAEWLAGRNVLLFLDNFEQVIGAAPTLARLLERAHHATCLVTSREALAVRGEHEVPVPPLPVPDLERFAGLAPQPLVRALSQYPSVRLFCGRANAVDPDFQLGPANALAVASACRRLDGIPLALELAASRLKVMSLETLGQQLEREATPGLLNVLGRGRRDSPQRHRTLLAAIDWSYQLLDPSEQRLFRTLAVFGEGWTLDAAGALIDELSFGPDLDALEAMAALTGKSLVHRLDAPDGAPRWSMLQALRSYALMRLRAEPDEWRAAHEWQYRWALRLLEGLRSVPPSVDPIDAERGNLRGVLEWAITEGHSVAALELGGRLWRFWRARTQLFEGRQWLRRILDIPDGPRDQLRAQVLHGASMLAQQQGDFMDMRRLLTEALEVLDLCADDDEVAVAIALATSDLARVLGMEGHLDDAVRLVEDTLPVLRRAGAPRELAQGLAAKGMIASFQGHPAEATALLEEAAALYRAAGDAVLEGDTLESLGLVLGELDTARAAAAAAEGLRLHEAVGYARGIAKAYGVLGGIACVERRFDAADDLLRRSIGLLVSLGDRVYTSYCLTYLGMVAAARERHQDAVRFAAAAQAFSHRTGSPMLPFVAARQRELTPGLRATLGAEVFDRAWAEGAGLSLTDLATGDAPEAASAPVRAHDAPDAGLTSREAEVLALVASGLADSEVADRLFVSARTVHAHLRSIYGKLGVTNRTAAARYAVDHGLVASLADRSNTA
jgi:predicted ATPase/DNA-binding CsgD family transcriptional regulator